MLRTATLSLPYLVTSASAASRESAFWKENLVLRPPSRGATSAVLGGHELYSIDLFTAAARLGDCFKS